MIELQKTRTKILTLHPYALPYFKGYVCAEKSICKLYNDITIRSHTYIGLARKEIQRVFLSIFRMGLRPYGLGLALFSIHISRHVLNFNTKKDFRKSCSPFFQVIV